MSETDNVQKMRSKRFLARQRERRKARDNTKVSKTSQYYAYVHEEDHKLFGIPIKLTKQEAEAYRQDTAEFMKRRGFYLARVEPLDPNDFRADELFHPLYEFGRSAESDPDPDLKYLVSYSICFSNNKISRRESF